MTTSPQASNHSRENLIHAHRRAVADEVLHIVALQRDEHGLTVTSADHGLADRISHIAVSVLDDDAQVEVVAATGAYLMGALEAKCDQIVDDHAGNSLVRSALNELLKAVRPKLLASGLLQCAVETLERGQ